MKTISMILILFSISTYQPKTFDFKKDIGAHKLEKLTISTFGIK